MKSIHHGPDPSQFWPPPEPRLLALLAIVLIGAVGAARASTYDDWAPITSATVRSHGIQDGPEPFRVKCGPDGEVTVFGDPTTPEGQAIVELSAALCVIDDEIVPVPKSTEESDVVLDDGSPFVKGR